MRRSPQSWASPPRTVKRFVSSLLEKTGYSNRTRLAIAVTKKNFILPHLEEE